MPTDTFYPACDGTDRRYTGSETWQQAHDAASGTDVYDALASTNLVYSDPSLGLITRGFVTFDTSALPDNAIILSATLSFYGKTSTTGTVGSVDLVDSTQASATALVAGDFSKAGTTQLATGINIGSWNTAGYNDFALNAAGLAAINVSGYSKFAVRHSSDRSNSAPASAAGAFAYFSEQTGTGNDPKLVVVWAIPKAITSDAVIANSPGNRTVTSDAVVKQTLSTSATADAQIIARSTVTASVTADARIDGVAYITPGTTRVPNAAKVQVWAAGTSGTHSAHHAFPCGVRANNNTLIAMCRKGTSHTILDGDLVMKTSADAGVTWSSETTIFANASTGYDERDPCVRNLGGRLALVWSRALAHSPRNRYYAGFSYSDDNGATWSTPVNLATGHDANVAVGSDIVQLPNGDLIVATYGQATEGAGNPWSVRLSKSTDNGATWSNLALVADGAVEGYNCVEPQLQRLPDGTLLCTYHTEDGPPQTHKYRTSTDNGATWSAATQISVTSLGNRAGLVSHEYDQDLVFAYTDSSRSQAYFKTSTNNAATWSSEITIGGGSSVSFYGGVWVSPFAIGRAGVDPNLGLVYGLETASQDRSEVWFRAYDHASTAYVQRARAVTADAVISANTIVSSDAVIRGPRSITSDAKIIAPGTSTVSADAVIVAGSATQRTKTVTADAVIMARGATRTLTADAIIASGAAPPGALVRPFAAPLVVSSATAPLVVSSATAPLSMETT